MVKHTIHINPIIKFLFKNYFKKILKKNFSAIFLKGNSKCLEAINLSKTEKIPIVFTMNHTNWWDGILVPYLAYCHYKLKGFVLMEYKQLKDHPYFNKIGAIPIIREDPRKSFASLKFCINNLKNTSKCLFIFPQGELVYKEKQPLIFFTGAAYIIEKLKKSILININTYIKYKSEQYPYIYIDIFKVREIYIDETFNRKIFTLKTEEEYNNERKKFNIEFEKDELKGYEIILKGRKSIDKRWK